MVQSIVDGLKRFFHIGKIHHPPGVGINVPGHVDLDAERVAVQPGTLVAVGDMRQSVCCLEGKYFKDFHERDYIAGFALWSFFQSLGEDPTAARNARAK